MPTKSRRKPGVWRPDGTIKDNAPYWKDSLRPPLSIQGVDSPGPQRYCATDPFHKLSHYKHYGSVKIAEGNPKSDVEWAIYRASSLPSAADYNPNTSDFDSTSGGQFSTAFVPSSLDWETYRASQIPGPGDYYPRTSKKNAGFKKPSGLVP